MNDGGTASRRTWLRRRREQKSLRRDSGGDGTIWTRLVVEECAVGGWNEFAASETVWLEGRSRGNVVALTRNVYLSRYREDVCESVAKICEPR